MNTALWIAQLVLAVVFVGSGAAKSTMTRDGMLATGQSGIAMFPFRWCGSPRRWSSWRRSVSWCPGSQMLGSVIDAEDVVQEALFRLHGVGVERVGDHRAGHPDDVVPRGGPTRKRAACDRARGAGEHRRSAGCSCDIWSSDESAHLVAGYHSELGRLLPLPFGDLALLAVGLPAVATLAGWLLAGREPPTFSRQALD